MLWTKYECLLFFYVRILGNFHWTKLLVVNVLERAIVEVEIKLDNIKKIIQF